MCESYQVVHEAGEAALACVPGLGFLGESDGSALTRRVWMLLRSPWVDPDWYGVTLDPRAAELLGCPLGPGLASRLSALPQGFRVCPVDHRLDAQPGLPIPGSQPGWPCVCQLVVAAAWEALGSWAAAHATQALVSVAGPKPVVVGGAGSVPRLADPCREDVALSMRLSPDSAANRIAAGRELMAHPELVGLVGEGVCSMWAARSVVALVGNLPTAEAAAVVAQTVQSLSQRSRSGRRPYSCGEVRQLARRAVARLGSQAAAEARCAARGQRRVTITPAADGMTWVNALLDEVTAHRIGLRLTAIARGVEDAARSCDQKRADVLADLLLGPTPTDTREAGGSVDSGTQVCVVISAEALLGFSQEPAMIPGLGAIPAAVARDLAADGRWRAWITDASGQVTRVGSRCYTPSPALARLIRARELYCRMPGCRRRSSACDLDHAIPFPAGPTEASNLGPLCRRHHIAKTHHGFHLSNDPGGWTWVTPAGLIRHSEPEGPLP